MSKISLTSEQQAVVDNRGGNLLVSAAAGSGKTKVLVERLFSYMEREERNVDDFLIITYTKAAAEELRGKIAVELSKRVAAEPDNSHLRRQMFRVYQADIKTVDAFCAALLRDNAYLLPSVEERSLTPDFRVLDQSDATLLKQRVLERVLEDFYQNMGDDDRLLAETLGAGRDDRALASLVLELHEKVQSHPYPERWLARMTESWTVLPDDLGQSIYGQTILHTIVQKAEFLAALLERTAAAIEENKAVYAAYGDRFIELAQVLHTYRAAGEDWEKAAAIEPKFRRMGVAKGDSAEKDHAKAVQTLCNKALQKVREPFIVPQREQMEDMQAMAPAMLALIRLTQAFSARYQTEKVRRNALDFSDQEHYAIRLLLTDDGQPTELAGRLAEKYCEIMVDEYQDSNEVQNCIFQAISRRGENLFTVGDIKQSIYRFRLADPGIFLEKYLRYADADCAMLHEPRRILLSKNFRSRQAILEATNFIFANIMSPEMGEMDYGAEEQLHFGAEYYAPRDDEQVEFHYIDVQNTDEENFERMEVEARFAAHRIHRLLDEGYPVQQEDGTMRPCTPEDIVILMRSPSSRLRTFSAALAREGIPCVSGEKSDILQTVEIAVTLSLLKIIDNPRQDVPLISVLRSPLFGFTPGELANIRALQRDGPFYDALLLDESEKTAQFLAALHELRDISRDEGVDRLLRYMYDVLHFPAVFGAMAGGEERRHNLFALADYVRRIAAGGKQSLFDFLTYLRQMQESGETLPISAKQGGRGVQIMTIHRSKGLEFPIVVLADLSRKFDGRDTEQQVLVHAKMGLGTVCVDIKRRIRYDTISKRALAMQLEREGKAEEMRILYVAMTRAKEKLIMIHCAKNGRKHLGELTSIASLPAAPEAVAGAGCLGDWVLLPLLCTQESEGLYHALERERTCLPVSAENWQVTAWHNPSFTEAGGEETPQEKNEEATAFDPTILARTYAFERATKLPTKVTATALKGRELDAEIAAGTAVGHTGSVSFDKPLFLQKEKGLNAAEKGTAMHLVMQYIDFSTTAAESAVQEAVACLRQRGALDEQQAAAVDCGRIAAFLASPLCRRIRESKTVYREYRFALLMPATIYDSGAVDEEMMLQGVADCVFETPDGLVIVDFKTDRINEAEAAARGETYRVQLEAYSAALSRVLEKPVCEKILYFFQTNSTVNL